ncbi:HVA22-like protein e [Miscanthus floridulus]|uniref:HVA22-like protein e n=1 Tax=Miscanthus floridulus TaxID=154761 RepID=UPI00345AF9E0
MESSSKLDDEQWLAYWILYSFITLMEMLLQSLIYWIPVWYELKLLFMAWLVLPNFRGAAFIYNRFVREQVKKHTAIQAAGAGSTSNNNVIISANEDDKILSTSPNEKSKRKLLSMIIPKKLKL